MNRCDGKCCRTFVLNPDVIDLDYDFSRHLAGAYIKDMLIPLGRGLVNPATGHVYTEPRSLWTCRHLDTDTGDCKAYESRPSLCRDHGSVHACDTLGCKFVRPSPPEPSPELKELVTKLKESQTNAPEEETRDSQPQYD